MPQTKGQEVIQYLDDIRIVSEDFYQITLQVRDIFLTTLPSLTESIKYGGIVFSINKDLMVIQYLDDIRIVSEDFYQITLQVRDIYF